MKNIFRILASYTLLAFMVASCQQEKTEPVSASALTLLIPNEEEFAKLSIALRYAAQLDAVTKAEGRMASLPTTITPQSYENNFVSSGVAQFGSGFSTEWNNFKALPQIQTITNTFESSDGTALVTKIINTANVSSAVKTQMRNFALRIKQRYEGLTIAEQYGPITEAAATASFIELAREFTNDINYNSSLTASEKNALLSDVKHYTDNLNTYSSTVSQINNQQIAAGGRLEAGGRTQKTRFGKFLVKLGNFATTVVVVTGLAILVAVTAPTGSTAAYIDVFKTAGYAAVLGVRGLFRPWNEQFWWT